MKVSQIDEINRLTMEAKHSFIVACTITNDPKINLILAKWPDVIDSIMEYLRNESNMGWSRVVSDIAPIIFQPIGAIAEGFIQILEKNKITNQYKNEYSEIMKSYYTDPVEVKVKMIELVNKLIPMVEELGVTIDPIKKLELNR